MGYGAVVHGRLQHAVDPAPVDGPAHGGCLPVRGPAVPDPSGHRGTDRIRVAPVTWAVFRPGLGVGARWARNERSERLETSGPDDGYPARLPSHTCHRSRFSLPRLTFAPPRSALVDTTNGWSSKFTDLRRSGGVDLSTYLH
ncbi:hypothetical protein NOCARDAX2BIS_430006 [Nocardioides sp. AX2bis]|nr:hypothetical protein NOCARDAX2BIS_430006 [Nocardioides sp. AX2bis]